MDATRRGFLKGIGALGAVMAGQFVLRDPQVIAGDLLVPNPEPTIIKATELPKQVTAAARGFVQSIDMQQAIVPSPSWYESKMAYLPQQPEINMHLRLIPEPGGDFNALLGNEVEVYVVRRSQ